MHFGDRLLEAVARTSPIVLGIDPDFSLFPEDLRPAAPTSAAAAAALSAFCREVIAAAAGLVPAVKLQSAFFEQIGSAGPVALAGAMAAAREAGLLVILDAKRGDIGSTSEAYARAYLGGGVDLPDGGFLPSDLTADALTVNPYLGDDAMAPFLAAAKRTGRGVFVLVKTSNPGSRLVMDVGGEGKTISERLADFVEAQGEDCRGASGYSPFGAVVGATFPEELARLRQRMPHTILLIPGVGAQGAAMAAVRAGFDARGGGAIVPISRALTYPAPAEVAAAGFRGAVRARIERFVGELRAAG